MVWVTGEELPAAPDTHLLHVCNTPETNLHTDRQTPATDQDCEPLPSTTLPCCGAPCFDGEGDGSKCGDKLERPSNLAAVERPNPLNPAIRWVVCEYTLGPARGRHPPFHVIRNEYAGACSITPGASVDGCSGQREPAQKRADDRCSVRSSGVPGSRRSALQAPCSLGSKLLSSRLPS